MNLHRTHPQEKETAIVLPKIKKRNHLERGKGIENEARIETEIGNEKEREVGTENENEKTETEKEREEENAEGKEKERESGTEIRLE